MNEENTNPQEENGQSYSPDMTRGNFTPPPHQPTTGSFPKTLLIIVVVAILLGGAAYGAYYFMQERGGPGGLSKEETITNSVAAYIKADSLSNTTDLEIEAGESRLKAKLDTSMQIAESISDTLFSLGLDIDALFREGGLSFELITDVEVRVVDGVAYILITKAPAIPFVNLSPLEGIWMHFDLEEGALDHLEDQFGQIGSNMELARVVETHGVEVLKLAQEEGLVSIDPLRSQTIDGDDSYVYHIDIFVERLPDFLEKFSENHLRGEQAETLKDIAREMRRSGFDNLDVTTDGENFILPLTIAIAKDSLHLKQITADFTIHIDQGTIPDQGLAPAPAIPSSFSVYLNSTFHSIGEPVFVEAPSQSRSFEEVTEEVFNPQFEGPVGGPGIMQNRQTNATIISSLSAARAEAELFYSSNQSYSGACLNMENLINTAIENSPADGSVSQFCNDSDHYWVSVVPLLEGGLFCSDSIGFAGEVSENLQATTTSCSELM